MARRRKKSIVNEVSQAITAINYIGQSKKEARSKNETGIHSIKQINETLSVSQNFVKWVKQYCHIQSLFSLTEAHYLAYLEHLKGSGRSTGHRRNVETALKHLQKGMKALSLARSLEPVIFVPEKRVTDWRELTKPKNRSYSHDEYERMLPFFSKSVKKAVKLMRNMGLRVRESCNIRVRHFHPTHIGGWELKIPADEASGITKGGRYRVTPVPKHFEQELLEMIHGKAPEDKVISVKPATIRKKVNVACKKANIIQDRRGTHGFRHLYCRERLNELLSAYSILTEGKQLLSRIMANRDINRKADYGILSDKDISNYKKLKKCIDIIHEEIGHGEDRWDLAEVYLREEKEENEGNKERD